MCANRGRQLSLVMFFIMLAMPAMAQTTGPAVEFIRQNPDYRRAVHSVAEHYESSLRTHCASVELDWNDAKSHVALQPTLDDQNHIQTAVWAEMVPGEACGQHRRYSAITIFKDGRPSVLPLFPGETASSPTLQQDTVIYVAQALLVQDVLPKDCHIDVLETRLPGGYPAQGSPWNERWRVDACGKEYWAQVRYTPDSTGTAISASSKDVVPVE